MFVSFSFWNGYLAAFYEYCDQIPFSNSFVYGIIFEHLIVLTNFNWTWWLLLNFDIMSKLCPNVAEAWFQFWKFIFEKKVFFFETWSFINGLIIGPIDLKLLISNFEATYFTIYSIDTLTKKLLKPWYGNLWPFFK